MAASDARPVPRKNTAFRFYFSLRNLSTGALITTWTGADSEVSLDGAAFADCTNEATEIGTTGCGYIDLTASEMNADAVLYKLTVTNTNAETLVVTFFPEESGDYRADVTLISGDATAADNAESFFDGTGYAGTNNVIPTVTTVNGLAANVITSTALATSAVDEIVDAVWDEVLSAAAHNVSNSAGKRLRQLGAASITGGTAQSGAANSITLASGESSTNEIFDSNLVVIVAGTGAGQSRVIVEYNGTTKVATVDQVWVTNPDVTSEYEILADHQSDIAQHGLAQAGGATSITLASTASATDDVYLGSVMFLSTSTGTGQSRLITAYNGTTKVATVSPAWAINPGSNSVYKIIPGGRTIPDSGTITTLTNLPAITSNWLTAAGLATDAVAELADGVWDEALSGHLTAGSTGEALNAAGSAGDPWTTTLPGSYTGSQAGKMLSDILTDTGTTLQAELDGIQADTEDIQTRLPATLVSGRIDASVGAMAANVFTASALATDAVSEIQSGLATPTNITAATGITVSALGTGVITAASIATDAIDADALAADAVTEIWAKAMTELTSVPGVTGTVLQALTWVFELSRNKVTQTATTQIVMRDDATTTLGESTVSDDGTTFSRGEFA